MPLAATRHTPAGAKAFAVFFIKTIDWGFATMNGAYIRHYARLTCQSCNTLSDGMDHDRRVGDQYIGGRLEAHAVHVMARPAIRAAEQTVVVNFDVGSFRQIDRQHNVVTDDVAMKSETFEVSIDWGSRWQVEYLGLNR